MSNVFDSISERAPLQRVWAGRIASNPTDFADRVNIIIPGFDSTMVEDCRWQARNTVDLPQRGDSCVAVIDDNNEAWVVVWWPF